MIKSTLLAIAVLTIGIGGVVPGVWGVAASIAAFTLAVSVLSRPFRQLTVGSSVMVLTALYSLLVGTLLARALIAWLSEPGGLTTEMIAGNLIGAGNFLLMGVLLALGFMAATRQDRAKQAFVYLAAMIGAISAYGIVSYFTGNDLILWVAKSSYPDDLTATFVNRNSFATMAGLGLVCSVGLLMRLVRRVRAEARSLADAMEIAARQHALMAAFLVAAILVTGSALFLTHSRAGLASTALGLVTLLGVVGTRRFLQGRQGHRRAWAASLAAAYALLSVAFAVVLLDAAAADTIERFARADQAFEFRLKVYQLTWRAIMDSPWIGWGHGTFEEVFRFYRTADIPVSFTKAHNTYLELMLELGIPMATLLVGIVAAIALKCLQGVFTRRRDYEFPAIGLAATVLVGSHSLVDFSLQIPAVAAAFAFILGIAWAESYSTAERRPRPSRSVAPQDP